MRLEIVNIGITLHVVSASIVGGEIDKTVRNIHNQCCKITCVEGTNPLTCDDAASTVKSPRVLFQA